MILTKGNEVKNLSSEKSIKRWVSFGWKSNEIETDPEEGDCLPEAPKKRGRPAKKED